MSGTIDNLPGGEGGKVDQSALAKRASTLSVLTNKQGWGYSDGNHRHVGGLICNIPLCLEIYRTFCILLLNPNALYISEQSVHADAYYDRRLYHSVPKYNEHLD